MPTATTVVETRPVETRMKLTDTKQHLSEVVNRVAQGESRVVIEKSGLPVAAIISSDDYRRFVLMDEAREARFAAMGRFSDAFADVPLEELESQVDRAVAEVRAQRRAERLASG
jgi:prevent-host-death family protein